MRSFKIFGIALMFAFSSIALVSCSDDDDNVVDNQPTVIKRLSSMTVNKVYSTGPITIAMTDFVYDKDGRLLSYMKDGEKISYEYASNAITISSNNGRGGISQDTYTIKDGNIIDYTDGYYNFKYSYSGNKLVNYKSPWDEIYTFDWSNGLKSLSFKSSIQNEDISYNYSTSKCLNQIIFYDVDNLPFYDCEIDPFLAEQGYYGDTFIINLPDSYTLKHSDGRTWGRNFKYQLDSDGYVTSMTAEGFGDSTGKVETYSFTWE